MTISLTNELQEIIERSKKYISYAETIAKNSKEAFQIIRQTSKNQRNQVLTNLIDLMSKKENQEYLIEQNQIDVDNAQKNQLAPALIDRLRLSKKRIEEMIQALQDIVNLPDPVGEIIKGYTLPNGIELIQKRVPLGSIFTVYESRPNVTIDVGALCIKSGNSVILRGGKEAFYSNKALYEFFKQALIQANLSEKIIQFVEETDRACMFALLQMDRYIDLVVPRGGEALIQFVSSNTKIPVVKHDKGVCNLYIDESAILDKAITISINAKLQRPSVCNAIENLLIHEKFPYAKELLEALYNAGAQLLGCEKTRIIFPQAKPIEDPDKEYSTEYLDNRLSVKIVSNLDEVVSFIYKYGSGHSEGIVAENYSVIEEFQKRIDSAGIFINCSTRFHDGGQMGMGAEIGISTQRMHVRGPMGLKDLTTTMYILKGNGQIRT
jgi:glutamate-5-semialdehyde dehydrogenase